MLEEPVMQQRQAEENPFHRELFSTDGLENLSKEAVNVGKEVLDLGKDAAKLGKDLAVAEVEGFTKVAGVLKTVAAQFEKFGEKLLMALKPEEKEQLNDSINKMGCPMAKVRAALAKAGGSGGESSEAKSV